MLAYEINARPYSRNQAHVATVGGGSGTGREVNVVASLSARIRLIGDNCLGGWHSYRASKTALNQLDGQGDIKANFNLARIREFAEEFVSNFVKVFYGILQAPADSPLFIDRLCTSS